MGTSPAFRRLLVVVKQTAYEEYSQVSVASFCTDYGLNFAQIPRYSSVHEDKRPKLYDGNVLNLASRHISNA